MDVNADGPIDEVDLTAVERMIHDEAGYCDNSSDGIELGEGEQTMEAAEDIRANANAKIQSDEVCRQGDADTVRRSQFNADGLTVRHERAIAEANEDAGQEQLPGSTGNAEEEQPDGQTNIAGIKDVIFAFVVEDDAGHRPRQGNDDCIDDEEERAGLDQVDFTGISSQESQDAGISKAHEETDDGNDQDPVFDVVVEGHRLHVGHLFRRKGDFVDMKGDAADHAQADENRTEGDDERKVRDDDEEHAQERTYSGSQAGAQSIIIDTFAPLFSRDTGRYNRVRRRRDDAVCHPVEETDTIEDSEIRDIKI